MTQKFFGKMTRKLSVTELQKCAQLRGTQQAAMPMIGFVRIGRCLGVLRGRVPQGPWRSWISEGRNLTVEYHYIEGQHERLPTLLADLVRRGVAVIATPGSTPVALAAKAATAAIPIVFAVGQDPVRLGLVASLARPGGNATGINFFSLEVR